MCVSIVTKKLDDLWTICGRFVDNFVDPLISWKAEQEMQNKSKKKAEKSDRTCLCCAQMSSCVRAGVVTTQQRKNLLIRRGLVS
jgi:hypothetical protein